MKQDVIINFLIGGFVFSLSNYYGSQGKGFLAAIIAFFPTITTLTLVFMYLGQGTESIERFTKGLALLIPGWIFYIVIMLNLPSRIGFPLSLALGVFIFIISSLILKKYFALG